MRAIWRQIAAVLSSNHHFTSISHKTLDIQYPKNCKNPLENATQNNVSIIIASNPHDFNTGAKGSSTQ